MTIPNSYTTDKNTFIKWLSGIVSTLIIIILTGIYSQLKQLNDFMIKTTLRMEYIEKKDIEQDSRITRLDEAVFIKPKEIKVEHE
jgi:hypothetical protein